MPESSFEEIVNIIWNIDNPEAQISKLLARLTELENKLDSVARKAAAIKTGGGGDGPLPEGANEAIFVNRGARGRFTRVSRSGDEAAEPSGIGAQYIPEGVRRRYTFQTEQSTPEDLDRSVADQQARMRQARIESERRGAMLAQQDWQQMMSRLVSQGHQTGSYGYDATSAYGQNQNRGLVNFGHDFSNSAKSTKQIFDDLKAFNIRSSEELAYYKSMWDAVAGTNPMALSVIGPQAQFRSGANRFSGQGQIPLSSVPWFTGAGSMAPGASTWIGPYTGAGAGYGPTAPGTGPFMGGLGGGYGGMGGGGAGGGGGGGYGPFGPYTYQAFSNTWMDITRMQANRAYTSGNFSYFEDIMQNQYNPARWAQMRTGAAVNQFETAFDINQVSGLQGGTRGGYAQHAYLGYKISDLKAQLHKETLAGNAPEVDRLGKAVKSAQDEYDRFGERLSIFDNKFMRHIAWIAQGILIWGALRLASDGVRVLVQELNNLEGVQARVGFINNTTAAGVATQSVLGAQYGLTPTQAGAGTLVGAQLGMAGADMNNARQLALVFGADQYSNALRELYQTEMRANAVGVQHVAIMDYIATAYKTAPGTLESYFDSLQQGILLSHDLGVEAEQAGLSILKMSEATEDSPERIATTIQSVIGMLRKGPVQDKLEGYGITTGTPGEMLRQVAAQVTALVESGDLDRAKALIDEVTGSLNAPTRQLQLLTDFQELNNLFTNTNTELSTMDELLANIGDTGQSTWDRLTAGVLAYVDSLLAAAKAEAGLPSGAKRSTEEIVEDRGLKDFLPIAILRFIMNPGQALAEGYNTTKEYYDAVGRQAMDEAMRLNYKTETGLDSRYSFGPYRLQENGLLRRDQADDPRYLDWLNAKQGLPDYASEASRFSYRPPGTGVGGGTTGPMIGPALPPEYPFGGFQTLPEGTDWNKFVSDVRKHETILATVPGYDVEQKQVAFWDESLGAYRSMIADLNAIRFATDEQRKLMQQQITGVFNVPAGGEALVAFFALTQGFVPNTKAGKAGAGAGSGSATDEMLGWQEKFDSMKPGGGKGKKYFDQFGIPVEARQGFNDYDHSEAFDKMDPDYFGIPDEARQTGKSKKAMSKMRKPAFDASERGGSAQGRALQSLTVNNNIRVYIDGRQVAHTVQRQNYRQFENIRNSAFTAPSTQVAV